MGRHLGQHFLANKEFAARIVEAASLTKDDIVLEIGPGRGILTELILLRVKKLIVVEIDEKLVRHLYVKFPKAKNLEIIHKDFLKLGQLSDKNIKFIANMPYYITSPIIQKLISWPNWKKAVITVQKEVADRISSKHGSREYGVLTISINIKAAADRLFIVPRQNFMPRPKVDSAVVRLTPLTEKIIDPNEEKEFFKLVHACFQQRRKVVANSISHNLSISKQDILKTLQKLDLSPQIRGEEIDLPTYLKLFQELRGYIT
ncbi:MAG: 16S rRNA (adenine(1518)-N(6)/adenine(1519)-N(6))-dimethyltransferase RsmA [bacterium]